MKRYFSDLVLRALASNKAEDALRPIIEAPEFDPNERNSSGLTPLRAAIMSGTEWHVCALAAAGAVICMSDALFARDHYPHKPAIIAFLQARIAQQTMKKIHQSRD